MVTLIGAGPGDPELLTLKGKRALESAEVVLYDRLAGNDILSMLPETAEKIYVGKNAGSHPLPQNEINELLLSKARMGLNVVRLKGGDPFVFGRGGEELEVLAENGIEFEVIPGVSSAIAAGAFAGIPVTHRDYASSLHIITGHAKENSRLNIDFKTLAKLEGTLVFMMSVSTLTEICTELINAGMESSIPAAIIENAASPLQRKFIGKLENLPEIAKENGVVSPSVLIVGEVCSLSERLDWFSRRSLTGTSIMVTRARTNASVLSSKLRELGCYVVEAPCIRLVPIIEDNRRLADALEHAGQYRWLIFTSGAGVRFFFDYLSANRIDIRRLYSLKTAAIGPETKNELEKRSVYVDYMPAEYNARALAEGLLPHIESGKVLLARAKAGTEEILKVFEENGVIYEDIPLYDTLYENGQTEAAKSMIMNYNVDYVTFTSSSTVEGFVKSFPDIDYSKIRGLCIGEKTAETARKYGITAFVSKEATIKSMVELLREMESHGNSPEKAKR